MKRLTITLGLLLFCYIAFSHVSLDYPVGGENFHPGQTVNIEWHIIIQHNTQNWDLYFSDDGGNSWQDLRLDIGVDTLTYSWTVPDDITDHGRIKIVQDNVGNNYEDESEDFIISATSGIDEAANDQLFDLFPNPANDYVILKSKVQQKITSLKILSSEGSVIKKIEPHEDPVYNEERRISLAGYPNGMYFLIIQTNGNIRMHKLIKR